MVRLAQTIPAATTTRTRLHIKGTVQSVGFRPTVYRLASELGLTGWVCNDAAGVCIEIQGRQVQKFRQRLADELPPLAQIDQIDEQNIPLIVDENHFAIKDSQSGIITTKVSPDVSICETCLTELFTPSSRYYRYPFINCTYCGPRYTIIENLPYDRRRTSMAPFTLCGDCLNAYANPLDRRYHAESSACDRCGPKLSHPVIEVAKQIKRGKIIALKSIGGYQLIADAKNAITISRLRKAKERSDKPFALMTLNVASARKIVHCNKSAEQLLINRERPIVLLPKANAILPEIIAPGLSSLGIMLAYSPLHYLLFHALLESPAGLGWIDSANEIVLVVTSANPSGCPLIKDDQAAQEKLINIADMIVSYNRDIVTRVDDSVAHIVNHQPCFIRRARSFTPQAISLPFEIPPTLALGAYLKNTICITRGKEAFISQHIGDLNTRETIQFYRETVSHLLKLLDVQPEAIVHDLHPDFYSTRLAEEFRLPTFAIQHHHAHIAAVAAEKNLQTTALGLALDGFGLGDHHANWGGELFLYQLTGYRHLGSLQPLRQPGGDIASRQAWRMAASVLFELNRKEEALKRFAQQPQIKSVIEILEKNINSPATSSCGRLFDAASALLGICSESSYEGQAAMQLESKVTQPIVNSAAWKIINNQLNLLPLFNELIHCDAQEGANVFHGTLGEALVQWVLENASALNISSVILAGGCFLNCVLSEYMINKLTLVGLKPLYAQQCPPNDGGISLGQAWIAGNQFMERYYVSCNAG